MLRPAGLLSPLLLLAAVLTGGAGPKKPAPPAGPPAVGVVDVAPQTITQSDQFVGRIEAVNRVAIVARVTAFIEAQNFVEGSEVTKGQQLFQLERGPFEADVQQRAGAVAQIQATQANDQIKYNRAIALLNTPAGQRSSVDDTRAQLLSDQAQLMQNQAQLRAAQIDLDYTNIISPIDGKIGLTLITVGNVVSPSSGTLVTIVSQDPMYVAFPVSRSAQLELRARYATHGGVGAVKIRLRLQDGSLYDKIGNLVFVDNTVNTGTDTVLFRGTIANPLRNGLTGNDAGSRALSDGQFVTVLLQGVAPVRALGIPRAAVLTDQQGDYVLTVDAGNVARRTAVELGHSTATTAIVTGGLQQGERVIVDGIQRARPDQKVLPGPASPMPNTGAGNTAPD
jgi:membrane fusion protein (multidrug efflux system)